MINNEHKDRLFSFLIGNRADVRKMCITEYNEAKPCGCCGKKRWKKARRCWVS